MKIDIGIDEESRKKISEGLCHLLADTYTLYLKTHSFHWNVTGPMFETLHLMFEKQYNDLWQGIDEIAERIRALGFPAPGSYSQFAKLTAIDEEPGAPRAKEMLKQLLLGHETIVRTSRSIFSTASDASDEATIDLLTQRINHHEKIAWMLRSMLEE